MSPQAFDGGLEGTTSCRRYGIDSQDAHVQQRETSKLRIHVCKLSRARNGVPKRVLHRSLFGLAGSGDLTVAEACCKYLGGYRSGLGVRMDAFSSVTCSASNASDQASVDCKRSNLIIDMTGIDRVVSVPVTRIAYGRTTTVWTNFGE